jgi:hypothetical protein
MASTAKTPLQKAYENQAAQLIKALNKRNMTGHYFPTAVEAVKAVCEMIPDKALVGLGGSVSIVESGLVAALREKDVRMLDRYKEGVSKEEVAAMRYEGLASDVYIMSSNAITRDGKLVNIDGSGNRVAALIFGPKKVIVFAGMNKVCADVESALKRVKNTATPPNALRVGVETPCSHTGFCQDPHCQPPNRICAQTVITEASMAPDRIHVVLVGESLGF